MNEYTLERGRVEICDDANGLDLVEIRQVSGDGNVAARITMTHDQAKLVVQALSEKVLKTEHSTESKVYGFPKFARAAPYETEVLFY